MLHRILHGGFDDDKGQKEGVRRSKSGRRCTRYERESTVYGNMGSIRFEVMAADSGLSGDLVLPVDVDYGDMDEDGDIDYVVCDDKGPAGPGKLVFRNVGGDSFVQHILKDSTEFDQAVTVLVVILED
jgi:hypothetical protein